MKKILVSLIVTIPFLSSCYDFTVYSGDQTITSFDENDCNDDTGCENKTATYNKQDQTFTIKNTDGNKQTSTFKQTNEETTGIFGEQIFTLSETSRTITCPNGKTTTFYPEDNATPPAPPAKVWTKL
ncbi:hypothetical protein [Candidatus Odyssella acanthamoebae]|uniref:Lipoprotein n=1 Tax=Candidatus Odyssella acanthamoebae TaxID=91604 RepID=A0A077AZ78_9PROT|nr:hypothetical protein [Candidatus Paracaedibacter acanthamoebae]AIK96050.1 hypothetical protein ID47_03765 [Candidatus Paracaedibacter acanthamoebae]